MSKTISWEGFVSSLFHATAVEVDGCIVYTPSEEDGDFINITLNDEEFDTYEVFFDADDNQEIKQLSGIKNVMVLTDRDGDLRQVTLLSPMNIPWENVA